MSIGVALNLSENGLSINKLSKAGVVSIEHGSRSIGDSECRSVGVSAIIDHREVTSKHVADCKVSINSTCSRSIEVLFTHVSSLETKSLVATADASSSVSISNESHEVSDSLGLSVGIELEGEVSNLVSSLRDCKNGSRV